MDLASVSAVEVMAEEWISTTILSMVSQPGALERRGTATLLFDEHKVHSKVGLCCTLDDTEEGGITS
jgi:hypothetical protein